MKKVLFFTVFAILGLASCSKSEIEYDNQPQEISLFAVNKVATKAPVEGNAFLDEYNMMVAAYLAAGDGVTPANYFNATQFSKNGSYWTGGKYWPISAATLNFLAVAPEVSGVVVTSSASTAAKSVTTVSGNETWATQYDVMYATARASKNAATPPTDVDMTFKHAYSLIDFNFKKASLTPSPTITINSITIYGVACDGILTVNVANSTDATGTAPEATHVWSSYTPVENIAVPREPSTTFTLTTTNQRYYKGIMLIPNAFMNKFVINYTIDGQTFDYTYVPASSTWAAGTKYIYNITMTPSLIQVDPTVTVWGNDSSNNKDIELDTPPTP